MLDRTTRPRRGVRQPPDPKCRKRALRAHWLSVGKEIPGAGSRVPGLPEARRTSPPPPVPWGLALCRSSVMYRPVIPLCLVLLFAATAPCATAEEPPAPNFDRVDHARPQAHLALSPQVGDAAKIRSLASQLKAGHAGGDAGVHLPVDAPQPPLRRTRRVRVADPGRDARGPHLRRLRGPRRRLRHARPRRRHPHRSGSRPWTWTGSTSSGRRRRP